MNGHVVEGGFVWRDGLGWHAVELAQQPLALGALAFGELVHELMRRNPVEDIWHSEILIELAGV